MAAIINLTIDDRQIRAMQGELLLWVALEIIYIFPTCARTVKKHLVLPHVDFVSLKLKACPPPVPAYTLPVTEGLVVKTRGPQADDYL